MKQYKSIFKESGGSLVVGSTQEAQQIVDISNLEWRSAQGKMYQDESVFSAPSGWRLPTVQELYTAYVQEVKGFYKGLHWSASAVDQSSTGYFWTIDFKDGRAYADSKKLAGYVRYVKEINISYENKIESLLALHLKKNYNKSPKEIDIISNMIKRILDEIESRGTSVSQMEADKIVMYISKILFEG